MGKTLLWIQRSINSNTLALQHDFVLFVFVLWFSWWPIPYTTSLSALPWIYWFWNTELLVYIYIFDSQLDTQWKLLIWSHIQLKFWLHNIGFYINNNTDCTRVQCSSPFIFVFYFIFCLFACYASVFVCVCEYVANKIDLSLRFVVGIQFAINE